MATKKKTEWNLSNESPHLFVSHHPRKQKKSRVRKDKSATSTTRSFPTALMLAAKTGSLRCCKLLILVGVELDAKDSKGMTAAMMTIMSGNLECLKVLAEAGAKLDLSDCEGRTAAMLAAQSGRLECLKVLAEAGAKLDLRDCEGKTAAMLAAQSGRLECLKVLAEAGANLDLKDCKERTAAILAAQSGRLECLKVLAEAGANLDLRDCEGRTAAILAAQSGSVECLQYLLGVGSDIEEKDYGYPSPLQTAVKFNQLDCLRVLLQAGVDPNKSYCCYIPLIMATLTERVDCLRALIQAGADLNRTNCEGNKALMFAARKGMYEHVKILVEAGADTNMDNIKGETALMMAVKSNCVQCVSYLIQKGADINAFSFKYNTALMFAARDGNYDQVKFLVEIGAEINVDNIKGETALMMAAESNSLQCVSYLIQKEADVNASSSEGNTALMFAARHGRYEYVKFLVEAGAEINVKNIRDSTALIKAVESNDFQCVSYLIHKGADVSACTSGGLTTLKAAMLNHNTDIMILLLRAPGARGMLFCMGYLDWGLFLTFLRRSDDYSVHRPLNELFRSLVSSFAVTDVNVQHIERKTVLLHLLLSPLDAHENFHTSAEHEASGRGPVKLITEAYMNWVGACGRVLLYNNCINFQDSNGRTVLWHAAYAGHHFLSLLIELGANTDNVDRYGESVFMVAIARADKIQIHQLIMGGADLNVRNREGDTPLLYALKLPGHQYQAISRECQLMLQRSNDVNIRNDFQATPLMVAVRNPGCSFEMLEMMVMKGADIHAVDKYGNSALIHALQSICDRDSKLDRVTWLLKQGVEPILDDIRSLTRVLGGRYSNKFSVSCHSINELITEGRTDIIRLVVSQGVFPAVDDLSNRYHAVQNEVTSIERKVAYHLRNQEKLFPPFIFALINKRVDIAKYFALNLFLTQSDLAYRMGSDLDSLLDEEGRQFSSSVHSKPWSLVNLALIALSERLGPGVEREDRVVKTCLPVRFQRMLMFQTPMAKLTVNQWKNIPVSSLWKTRQCPPPLAMLAALSCHSASQN